MRYVDELMTDHRAIERLIAVVVAMAARIDRGEPVPVEDMTTVVDFIRTFADACHHGKEQDLLFPAMEAAGIPNQGGPIGQMLLEHDQGRAYVAAMRNACDFVDSDPSAAAIFAANGRNYGELLGPHIQKEDKVLYPMAMMHISVDKQAELEKQFDEVEANILGGGKRDEYFATLERLESTYL